MPLARYKLRIEGDEFWESDYFPATNALGELIDSQIVVPMKKKRAERGEPTVELVTIEVLNPHVHAHDWKKFKSDAYACKAHYRCDRCGITGWRYFHLVTGESKSGAITRNEDYKQKKYDLCRDPLRPMPPAKTLRFK